MTMSRPSPKTVNDRLTPTDLTGFANRANEGEPMLEGHA